MNKSRFGSKAERVLIVHDGATAVAITWTDVHPEDEGLVSGGWKATLVLPCPRFLMPRKLGDLLKSFGSRARPLQSTDAHTETIGESTSSPRPSVRRA